MTNIIYDGSFEGLLTAVFEAYEYKFEQVKIVLQKHFQPSPFDKEHRCITDERKAERVWKGLKQKLSAAACAQLYKAFLSEDAGIENTLLQYIQHAFSHPQSIESDFSHPAVLLVSRTAKKVYREKHRMEAFIRFQLVKDNLYYAICQPDFNVLPLIEKHFKDRYADQRWLIFDSYRKYGIYYDLTEVNNVEFTFSEDSSTDDASSAWHESEEMYQVLWQQYFSSVNIAARKNTKLHVQHMPKRYWKYLPEKKAGSKDF
ncbi:MAG: domain often clustered or fused with uracil-DNA glycosylase [Segetibacter sp.]|nr:domain often clustered or fused with uracil-DNA glycosylase [Segetibacter sp.]